MPAKVIHGHSIEIELGPSCPNPGIRRELEAQGKPYMCTSDIATWIGVDNKWYYVYRPGVSTSIIPLLELTKDEDEPIATEGGSWRGNDNKFLWTSAIDDVFKDCFIPTTTYEKGPLQFEIDEQLNTTWYKK